MDKRIKVLAIIPAIMPSTTILVVEPLMYLMNLGKIEFRICLENLYIPASYLEWSDLIVFCRNTEPTHDILQNLLTLGKPYIYELDDNFFEIPLDVPGAKYHRAQEQITQLERYITNANLVRVYSHPLETRVSQYSSRVKRTKPPINLSSIPAIPPKRSQQKLKIVFPTSRTVSDNLSQIFLNDLVRILDEYRDNVEVHFWGFVPEELRGIPSVKFQRFVSNYPKYMQAIYKEGYDIGLAPAKNDLFHNSKTNNKFREYGACWITGIYSNTNLYTSCVEDGKTGLLVSNEEGAWYRAIIKLMHDPNLRQVIQRQARILVEQEYSLDAYATLLKADMNQVLLEISKSSISESQYKTKRVRNKKYLKSTMIFSRIIKMSVSIFYKIYGSMKNYGFRLTIQLILEQIERYIRYFELLWIINRRQI